MGNRDVLKQYAEAYIRDHKALHDHYDIEEVTIIVDQFTGIQLTGTETVEVVQKIRNEKGWGPIAEHNMPGYVEPEDETPEVVASEESCIVSSGQEKRSLLDFFKLW